MAPQDALAEAGQPARHSTGAVVNDFSIQVATVNGSGSQTANLVLLRSIFQMGIPVSGKNLFPSNIAGLPTWYTIRANKFGYIGRKKEIDFLVAMNPETAREDALALEPGSACVYDEPLQLKAVRSDITFYPVPFDKLVGDVTTDAKLRRLVRNMIYDGILSFLLDIELDEMKAALNRQLGKKPKAMALNSAALDKGYAYAEVPITYSFRESGRSFVRLGRYLRQVVPAVHRELNSPPMAQSSTTWSANRARAADQALSSREPSALSAVTAS